MAAKSRSLSGIWVPVQLDTSKIEAQLSKLRDNFSTSISGIQKDFDGALNTKKFADQLVSIPKQIGYIRDAVNGLKATESAFNKPIEGLKDIASAAGVSESKLKELYKQMATNQAVNQQVVALTQLQKSLGLTAQEAVRFAQANTQMDSAAISAFADKNQIAGLQQFSTELKKLAPNASLSATSFDQLNKEFTEFQAKQKSYQYISNLSKSLGLDNAALKKYRSELNITEKELNDFIAQQKAAASASRGVMGIFSPSSVSSAATSGLAAFGVSLGAYGLADLTKASFQANLALENVDVAFNSIYRDATKAEVALDHVSKTADDLGVSFLVAAEGAKKMFASAQGTVLETEVNDLFTSLTEAGVALRLDEQRMSSVFLAISQSIGKGKISAEELRSQLAEALPGAVQIFADSMDITAVELDKMLEQGQVGIETLIAFGDELSKRYGQGAADASTSLQAELGRLTTSWDKLKASFSNTGVAADWVRTLTDINKSITTFQPQIWLAVKALGAFSLSFVGVLAITNVGKIAAVGKAFVGLATSLKGATVSATALGASLKAISLSTPQLAALSAILAGIGLIMNKAFESQTPIIEASEAMAKFRGETEDTREELEKLANQNLASYVSALELKLGVSKESVVDLQAEIDYLIADISDKFDFRNFMTQTATTSGRNPYADMIDADGISENVGSVKTELSSLVVSFSELEKAFANVDSKEGLEKLKKDAKDNIDGIINEMRKLGVAEQDLARIMGGWEQSIAKFSDISYIELDLRKAKATYDSLKDNVEINTKDIENALKSLVEFSSKSELSEALSLDIGYEGIIGTIRGLQTEFDKFKDISEDLQGTSFMRIYEEGLASLYSKAAESPSQMASLNRALETIGTESEEAKRFVDSLRQSLTDLSGQDIQVRIDTLGLDGFSNYLENKLPKQMRDVSDIISSTLQLSGADLGSDAILADIDTLTSRLNKGLDFSESAEGLVSFRNLTEENIALIEKGIGTVQRFYVETNKSSSAAKKQSEAFKANEELYDTILSFEEKLRDSEYETFQVLEQTRQAELDRLIASRQGTAEEIELLKQRKAQYLDLYEQMKAYYAEEQAKEDASTRASFYDDLGSRISDTNMKMIALTNSIAVQRQEWEGLIPENLLLELEQLQKLDASYDFFDGMKRGFNELTNDAKDFATTAEELVTSAAGTMSSAFAEFTLGGARDFDTLMQSIYQGLLETAIQALSNQIINEFFSYVGDFLGSMSFGSSGGTGGAITSGAGSVATMVQHSGGQSSGLLRNAPVSAFANAPRFHNGGGYFKADEYPAILQYGERVLNRRETKDYNQGGSGASVVTQPIINIQNYSSEPVATQASADNNGNMKLDVMVGNAAGSQVNRPGSNLSKAIDNRYGIRPQPKRR